MSVDCWQDTMSLPTYLRGPDDPHPCFTRPIYPYNMQDDLLAEACFRDERQERDYLALHLENELLHVIVLPELGGRVFSAYDKLARREVFYRNNVVKPAMVGLRGAWISGGIEFNFFHRGHSQTTVSPVSLRKLASAEMHPADDQPGHGAAITVSNIDLTSRARWAITISLEPGDPRLHQRVWLRNRMPYRQRYYFWANAALPATDDLHLVYPAHKARFSREGIADYPIWHDRDLSLYRNHVGSNDIFALDVQEDFFGCYYRQSDAGMVHLADRAHSVGKKFFTWGTEDAGMIWEDLLTDEDGQYVELQSGRFVDQNVYEFMRPFQTMQWDEVWWPLHGIGDWVWASDDVVLNFRLQEGRAEIGALTWRKHEGARLTVRAGEQVLWSESADLAQDAPFTAAAELGDAAVHAEELTVTIEAGGRELLRYAHPPEHARKPSVLETGERERPEPKPEEQATAGELHVRAMEQELAGRYDEARRLYELALERDGALGRAQVGLGLLEYRAGRFESAREHFQRAVDLNRHDYEARYYLAMAKLAAGERDEARSMLRRLDALGMCHEEAAGLLLWAGACETAEDSPAAELERPEILRDEPEQWLEVASEYAVTGQLERAISLLRKGRDQVERLADHPLVHYTLAHYLEQAGDEPVAAAERERARRCDPDYCFPWRLEDLRILREAVERDPGDWLALHLLGTVLAARGRRDEALAAWLAAAGIHDGFSPLLRNIAWAYWHWRHDCDAAVEWYRRAIERRPQEYRLYLELDRVMEAAEWNVASQLELLRSAPQPVQDKWQMAARIAAALVALERWDEALEQMDTHRFIPWEGARGMRELWVTALLGSAGALADGGDYEAALASCWRALEYPRNLGVGRRAQPTEEAGIWRRAAEIAQQAGDEDARAEYQARADELAGDPGGPP